MCVCVVQPLSFVIFLMGAAGLGSATSASADTNPVEREGAGSEHSVVVQGQTLCVNVCFFYMYTSI